MKRTAVLFMAVSSRSRTFLRVARTRRRDNIRHTTWRDLPVSRRCACAERETPPREFRIAITIIAARSMGAEAGRKRRADEASGSARRIEVEDVKALFAEQKGHLDYFFDEVRARFPFDPLSTSSSHRPPRPV